MSAAELYEKPAEGVFSAEEEVSPDVLETLEASRVEELARDCKARVEKLDRDEDRSTGVLSTSDDEDMASS